MGPPSVLVAQLPKGDKLLTSNVKYNKTVGVFLKIIPSIQLLERIVLVSISRLSVDLISVCN